MTERQTDRRADRKRTIPYKRKKLSTKWNGERWIKNVRGQRKEGWWNKSKSPFFFTKKWNRKIKVLTCKKRPQLETYGAMSGNPRSKFENGSLTRRLQCWEVTHPISLCYAAANPLHVPFPIDFRCAISKAFLIEDMYHDWWQKIMHVINNHWIVHM